MKLSRSRKTCVFSASSASSSFEDVTGEREIPLDVRVQRVAQHPLCDVGHPRNVDELLDRRVTQVATPGLGDVDRKVSDPFEVGVDLHAGDDGPEVDRHRLIQGQHLEAAAVDLDVQLVDRLVAAEHLIDELRIPLDQRPDGGSHAVFSEPAHFEQTCLELFELFLEVRNRRGHVRWSRRGFIHSSSPVRARDGDRSDYPNRPVT